MNHKRRALGRGLGALIPTTPDIDRPVDVFFAGTPADAAADEDQPEAKTHPDDSVDPEDVGDASSTTLRPVPGAHFVELPLESIRPNPRQPRSTFDEDELAELVHSIREIGVLQPVVVRPTPDEDADDPVRFELVMGERRWRAATEAGMARIPAIVRTTSDEHLLRDALLENLHRSQLNPLEEAAAYQQLLDDFGCSQEELAGRIGRSRPQVSNTLRLLRLPPLVQRRVAAGVLTAGHARALLSLDDAAAMERVAQRIVAEGLSVRSVEEIVTTGLADGKPTRQPKPGSRRPQLDDLAHRLSDRLDTRVQINLGRRRGKMVVEFASMEDLDRVLAIMGLEQPDVTERL